jgi:hypothetical protein
VREQVGEEPAQPPDLVTLLGDLAVVVDDEDTDEDPDAPQPRRSRVGDEPQPSR